MTDRDLLELAAKAAGIALDEDCQNHRYRQDHEVLPEWVYWNPLADDGDALRLAVKLRIRINEDNSVQYGSKKLGSFDKNRDPYEATRKSIVRAAAEIGSQMK